MSHDDAEVCAVVMTAQLMAALPTRSFDIDVCQGAGDWSVVVSWQDGVEADTIAMVLDGPPPGVVLLHNLAGRS